MFLSSTGVQWPPKDIHIMLRKVSLNLSIDFFIMSFTIFFTQVLIEYMDNINKLVLILRNL